jgi:hypothetical protein
MKHLTQLADEVGEGGDDDEVEDCGNDAIENDVEEVLEELVLVHAVAFLEDDDGQQNVKEELL